VKYIVLVRQKEAWDDYRHISGYEVGSMPFKYLGIPIHYRHLLNKEWKLVEDDLSANWVVWLES
jgi:hypothetical protein